MKTVIIVILLPTLALAQSLNGLPKCAQTCALNAISGSGCQLTDVACICKSPTFISAFDSCVSTSCNAKEAAAAGAFGIKYCASAGVTIVPSTTAPASAAISSTVAAGTSSALASVSVSASASAAPSSTVPPSSSVSVVVATGAANVLGGTWALLGLGGLAALV